jgi:hypothetical protein
MAQVTFTPNPQPAPACYPSDVNGLLNLITTGGGISGTIPDNSGGGIFIGSTPPSSSLTNKVWFKIDAAGRPLGVYSFYNGNWRKVYTGVGYGELRMYTGSNTVFDGNGLGIIGGDFDGWQLCNGNNGTQNLEAYFLVGGVWGSQVGQGGGWFSDADGVSWKNLGGQKGPIHLTTGMLPALAAKINFALEAAQGNQVFTLGGSTPDFFPVVDAVDGGGTGQGVPLPLPLFYAVAYMMFIGYQ